MLDLVKITDQGIERSSEDFYSRLSPTEKQVVEKIAKGSAEYMKRQSPRDYLVAGVGGVLRRENPFQAEDIDLAVVGLKYTSGRHDHESHSWQDVVSFTKSISSFFEHLSARLSDVSGVGGKYGKSKYGPSPRYGESSGPFEGADVSISGKLEGVKAEIDTYLERFHEYDSKGLTLSLEGLRPIDIQFIFNKTVEEWIEDQGKGYKNAESQSERAGKSPLFLYAPLHSARSSIKIKSNKKPVNQSH